jgi:hypothetical protein
MTALLPEDAAYALTYIAANLWSPNETDSNGEPANVVDGLFAIARALQDVAYAITETGEADDD